MPLHTERCKKSPPLLTPAECATLLIQLSLWQIEKGLLVKTFQFANYYETLAFVNASAWISHQQNHHPELIVSYKHCKVCYHTHSVHGLSQNDFICAARLDQLIAPPCLT
jgi:4a-hydroxytetrahydrobiopterin dehydratase